MPFERYSIWETSPKIRREMPSQSFSRIHLLKFHAAAAIFRLMDAPTGPSSMHLPSETTSKKWTRVALDEKGKS